MYNSIVAILTWLAADPTQVDVLQPQAAACSRMAYSLAAREPVQEEEEDTAVSESRHIGGTTGARPEGLSNRGQVLLAMYMCMCIYVYVCVYRYVCVYLCVYI